MACIRLRADSRKQHQKILKLEPQRRVDCYWCERTSSFRHVFSRNPSIRLVQVLDVDTG